MEIWVLYKRVFVSERERERDREGERDEREI